MKSGKVHCSWENEDGIESDQRLTWQRGHISSLQSARRINQRSKFSIFYLFVVSCVLPDFFLNLPNHSDCFPV